MKILVVDIETAPNLAYVWGLFDQNIGINMLKTPVEVLCVAAKWLGEKDVMFFRNWQLVEVWDLLDQADVVVHYNGVRFDLPHLNREFLQLGLTPPSPFKQIDLLRVVKQRFEFPSNKLAYVSKALGIGLKAETGGFETWVACLNGDEKAWAKMEKYNRQDVVITEKLYRKLLPWIAGHPSRRLYDGGTLDQCPTCGGKHLVKRGLAYTNLSKFQRFHCTDCGSYFRSSLREAGVRIQPAVL
jgi:hypothetical protein